MSLQNTIDAAKALRDSMLKGEYKTAADRLHALACAIEQVFGQESDVSDGEIKKFNGIMKYILVAFENGDFVFGSEVIKNDLLPLLTTIQLKEVKSESIITEDIDKKTEAIKEQYTDFMYPNLWHGIIPEEVIKGQMIPNVLYNLEYIQQVACREIRKNEELDVLIAGCGTGEGAVHCALYQPNANYTWIDISPASLSLAKQYADDIKLNNVNILQADIMTMDLGKKFDIIICTGVIHHLSNPSEGVANLKKHLKDWGVLSAMVYGEYGRFEIGLFQEALKTMLRNNVDFNKGIDIVKVLMKELGISNRIANIAWKEDLALGEQHVVDLLLNVNENRYNIKSLSSMLAAGGMKIIDIPNKAQYNPNNYIRSKELREMANKLDYIDKCYLAELINGRISKHNFLAVKEENSHSLLSIDDRDSNEYYAYKSPVLIEMEVTELKKTKHAIKLNSIRFEDIANGEEYMDTVIEGPYIELLRFCDGKRTISQIIRELKGKLSEEKVKEFIRFCEKKEIIFLH